VAAAAGFFAGVSSSSSPLGEVLAWVGAARFEEIARAWLQRPENQKA